MSPAHKAQITIAAFGLVGVLGGALFTNWDKIFPNEPPVILPSVTDPELPEINPNSPIRERYKVEVYYSPNRKVDAKSIAKFLEQEGYIVNISKREKRQYSDEELHLLQR